MSEKQALLNSIARVAKDFSLHTNSQSQALKELWLIAPKFALKVTKEIREMKWDVN